jgi:hypothetical protein
MHRFRADLGYAAASHRAAAKWLGMSERQILRGRDLLVKRGWLYRINGTPSSPGARNTTARYSLGGGSEELNLAARADTGDST